MSCFFSSEDIIQLREAKADVRLKFEKLRDRYAARTYQTNRGREYAFTGLLRRLDLMIRVVDWVFETLPPEKEDIPSTEDTVAAGVLIQSFVINLQGCLDNLAWIWVFETDLKDKSGHKLDRRVVGLGNGYWVIRRSFSKQFRKYLKKRKAWFEHVSEFRDSLAHRIPLYVPPFILSREHSAEYHRLEREAFDAGQKGDYKAYDDLKAQQLKLGVYRPWMTHSPTEGSPAAVFHQQLLQDFLTIDECASRMLDELSLFDTQPKNAASVFAILSRLGDWLWQRMASSNNRT